MRVCVCLSAVRICDLRSAQPLSIITPSIWPCELAHSMLQILRAQTRVVWVVCFVAATRHDFALKQCSNALHGVEINGFKAYSFAQSQVYGHTASQCKFKRFSHEWNPWSSCKMLRVESVNWGGSVQVFSLIAHVTWWEVCGRNRETRRRDRADVVQHA